MSFRKTASASTDLKQPEPNRAQRRALMRQLGLRLEGAPPKMAIPKKHARVKTRRSQ